MWFQTKSALDDTSQRYESCKSSLEAARKELVELQRNSGELQRLRAQRAALEERATAAEAEAERPKAELAQLRADMAAGDLIAHCNVLELRLDVGLPIYTHTMCVCVKICYQSSTILL